MNETAAIILAAGKGKRLNCRKVNKVMLPIAGKPMLSYPVALFQKMKLNPIIVVVGFAADDIKKYFGDAVQFVLQKKRLGTAHAAACGIKALPQHIHHVLIVNGDDSYLYSEELLTKLIATHRKTCAAITLLTVHKDNAHGLGRIVRNKKGVIVDIVEEKDATEKVRKINEINPQCWIFDLDFLRRNLPNIKKSTVTGEYYLTDMVKLAVAKKRPIDDVQAGNIPWRGVNTADELRQANELKTT